MLDLIAASTWVVLACVALSFSMFSPLPFASKRLIWLVCSIPQLVALQDGPYHAILSTTSSMALRAQALNGFESMCLVRGNQSPNPPWDRLRMTQPPIGNGASSTTSTCTGLVTAREAPLWAQFPSQSHTHPFTHGSIVTGSPEARPSAPQHCTSSFRFGITRPHVRWAVLFVGILELGWWLMFVLVFP